MQYASGSEVLPLRPKLRDQFSARRGGLESGVRSLDEAQPFKNAIAPVGVAQ